MFGVKTFLSGLLMGAGGMLFAMQFHLVRTNDGLTVIPRSDQPPLRSSYVDVRRWSLAMWRNYPEVTEALVKSGRVDLLATGAAKSLIPEQASTDSSLEGVGETVKETTRQAMQALVPIRFTQQEAAPPSDQHVPEHPAVDSRSSLAARQSDEAFKPQGKTTNSAPEPVLPEGIVVNESGLPVLERPVPIPDDVLNSESPAASRNTSSGESENQADWVRGLLRSLIPPNEGAASNVDHSHARSPFKVQAPAPPGEFSDGQAALSPTGTAAPAPPRAVRPF